MEGKFTFTDAKDPMPEWAYDLFKTQHEAIEAGLKEFPDGVLVGQLEANGENFKVVNVYKFTELTLSN